MFEASVGTALTFILLFTYFGIRKIAGYAWLVDIALFALFLWLFNGTYAGMMTGILAGLMITVFLKLVRRTLGYQHLCVARTEGQGFPRITWKEVIPRNAAVARRAS